MFEHARAFASYAVPDVDAVRTFYAETLGLRTSVN